MASGRTMAGSAWTNQLLNLIILVAQNAGFSGFFVYSPVPGTGNLIGSWAAAAGTDPYGNPYPQGLQIGNTSAPAQVLITQSADGQAAEVSFPMPGQSLSNVPNIAGGVVLGGPLVNLLISGPAISAASDWVQIVQFSNDFAGNEARCEFRYIDLGGTAHVMGTYNGNEWVFSASEVQMNTPAVLLNNSAASTIPVTDPSLNLQGAAPAAYSQSYAQATVNRVNAIINDLINAGIGVP
jgi:hypothetical protein